MSASEIVGRVELFGGSAIVFSHPRAGRAVHVGVGPVTVIIDLTASEAAALAALLTAYTPPDAEGESR